MALTTAELTRIKAELGFNVLQSGAEPYIGVTLLFEQIIAVYMTPDGEVIIREYLANIAAAKARMATAFGEGALKKVDEVEFYQGISGSLFGAIGDQVEYWRIQLAAALGLESMWSRKRASGSRLSVY